MAESRKAETGRYPTVSTPCIWQGYGAGLRESSQPQQRFPSHHPSTSKTMKPFGNEKNPYYHQQQSFVQTGVRQQVFVKSFLIQIRK